MISASMASSIPPIDLFDSSFHLMHQTHSALSLYRACFASVTHGRYGKTVRSAFCRGGGSCVSLWLIASSGSSGLRRSR